ncbi:MAG TPA: PAS domain-containing protein [Mucilaginibacter sp.]|nr:PAS domain-containing protein [Mucilaginibacter sp.]HVW13695.1 PAS domain-containing protein [Mucilaginibacter sp.]
MLRSTKAVLVFLVASISWLLFGDRLLMLIAGPLTSLEGRISQLAAVLLAAAATYAFFKKDEYSDVNCDEQYRQLFDLNPNPLWIYNNYTLRIVRVNNAAVERYGYSREKFLRMTIADIRPFDERKKLTASVKENSCDFCLSGQWKHLKACGGIIDVSIVSYPIDFNNQPCCLVIATDITDLLEKERKLENAYQKIKNFNETLRQIAWSNSHEMRKPVCSIISLVSLLKHTDNPQERRQYQNLLETAATELDAVLKQNEKMTETEAEPTAETV